MGVSPEAVESDALFRYCQNGVNWWCGKKHTLELHSLGLFKFLTVCLFHVIDLLKRLDLLIHENIDLNLCKFLIFV